MQLTLEFPITKVDSRDTIRKTVQGNGQERSFIVQIDKIKIRNGFNLRRRKNMSESQYNDFLGISELADGIFKSCGSHEPIIGDFVNGIFYITEGERRYRAIKHLIGSGKSAYPNGKPISDVEILLNPKDTDDLTRTLKIFTTGDKKKLTPMETAYGYLKLKKEFQLSNDMIAEKLGVSRQKVDMYIKATELTDTAQNAIDDGTTTISEEIAKFRTENPKQTKKSIVRLDEETGEISKPLTDEELISEIDTKKELEDKLRSPLKETSLKETTHSPATNIHQVQQDRALWKQLLNAVKDNSSVFIAVCDALNDGKYEFNSETNPLGKSYDAIVIKDETNLIEEIKSL